jgi:hypothetical protein
MANRSALVGSLFASLLCLGSIGAPQDTAAIETATGLKGTASEAENVFKVTAPRTDVKVTAFAGTAEEAIVDGDFVVLESELQPVLRSLRKDEVNIVAIHHHMTGETPRYLFLHYWGRGPAEKLATAVKTALGQTAK